MIKLIAFDLVGVLVKENDIKLTELEERLERLFGPNISDDEYLLNGSKYISNKKELINTTINIINKIYDIKDINLFSKLKNKYPNTKIIIATNHITYIKDYIINNLDIKNIDDIIISSEINRIKPNKNFYEYLVNNYNLKSSEILFLDDNSDNVDGAKKVGINTILVKKDMDLFEEIEKYYKIK